MVVPRFRRHPPKLRLLLIFSFSNQAYPLSPHSLATMTNDLQEPIWERAGAAVIDGKQTTVQARVWRATQDKMRP